MFRIKAYCITPNSLQRLSIHIALYSHNPLKHIFYSPLYLRLINILMACVSSTVPPPLCELVRRGLANRRWWRHNKDNHHHVAANYHAIITANKLFIAGVSFAEGEKMKMLLFCWKSSSLNSEMITLWKPLEGQIQSASVCLFFFYDCSRYKRKTSAACRDWVFAQLHLR